MTERTPLPVGKGVARRRRRLELLRRQIASGSYRVEAGEVADAILREVAARRRW